MNASNLEFDPLVVATITHGRSHPNDIPACPEGFELKRVWALIDEKRLRDVGLVHRVSAFVEDEGHDYKIRHGKLYYFSHQSRPGEDCKVVFEFAPVLKVSAPRPRKKSG